PVAKFPDGNQFTDAAAACSPAAGIGTITPGSGAETMGNRDHHENRSSGPPLLACDGPSDLVNRGMGLIPATCMFTVGYYGYPQIGGPGSNPMAPFHLSAAEHWASPTRPGSQLPGSASALLKRSNTIFAYRHSPETQGKLRANYDAVIQEGYNSRGGLFGTLVNPVRGASGLWAISRSELTYPKPVPGLARHGTWMWHSGWTAKLRPVALPGEFAAVSRAFPAAGRTSVLNAMYHDVLPYLAAGATLMGLTGSGNFSFTAFAKDFYYMEKATVSMDNESSNALPK
ncbi:MAG: hypothetical protein ABEL76_13200, partial [Bradymonadaceae bacterium]